MAKRNHSDGMYTVRPSTRPRSAGSGVGFEVCKWKSDGGEEPSSKYFVELSTAVVPPSPFIGTVKLSCDCPAKWRKGVTECKHERLVKAWDKLSRPIGAQWQDVGGIWASQWVICSWLPGFEPVHTDIPPMDVTSTTTNPTTHTNPSSGEQQ